MCVGRLSLEVEEMVEGEGGSTVRKRSEGLTLRGG